MVFGKLKGDLFIYSDYSALMIATFLHFTSSVDATAEGYLTVFFLLKMSATETSDNSIKDKLFKSIFSGTCTCKCAFFYMRACVFVNAVESVYASL